MQCVCDVAINPIHSMTAMNTHENVSLSLYCSFSDLPAELKLRIFSLLSATERGIAARVCREWRALMRVSTLWAVIDTSQLPVCTIVHSHGSSCRTAQRHRACQFLMHVGDTRAVVRRLCLAGDICDAEWRGTLESFFSMVRLHELTTAQLEWASDEPSDNAEANERARRAQRHFVGVFETFTQVAPKLSTLILPFDWSDRSVQLLLNLSHIHTLVLEKYFTYQCLTQSSLDAILAHLRNLRRLHLEVWIASGNGSVAFSISSPTLEFLDLSQCRGFDVAYVDLPRLSVIKLSRVYPWHGSLIVRGDLAGMDICHPCVREVLACGALNLRVINEHKVNPQWSDFSSTYSELELVLSAVCSCAKHRAESWDL
jgi:hypothetical protein